MVYAHEIAIALDNVSVGDTLKVMCCVRFPREGLPLNDEKYTFNVSVGHRTSREWEAITHHKSHLLVSSPFTANIQVIPTSSATGFSMLIPTLSSENGKGEHSIEHLKGELVTMVATIQNTSRFPLEFLNTTLSLRDAKVIPPLSGQAPSSKMGKATGMPPSDNLAPGDCLTRVFVIPSEAIAGETAGFSADLLQCEWRCPSTAKQKDKSMTVNYSNVVLPVLQVVEPPTVSVNVLTPAQAIVGEPFDMLLQIRNIRSTPTTVSFAMRLGSDFLCAGRMRGSMLLQPGSSTRIQFRLIGVAPGSVKLPALVVKAGENKTTVLESKHAGNILILPQA